MVRFVNKNKFKTSKSKGSLSGEEGFGEYRS